MNSKTTSRNGRTTGLKVKTQVKAGGGNSGRSVLP
jgi:hypothetical protein